MAKRRSSAEDKGKDSTGGERRPNLRTSLMNLNPMPSYVRLRRRSARWSFMRVLPAGLTICSNGEDEGRGMTWRIGWRLSGW